MKYDVIIIGAGPSGIFCAYELIRSNPEMKILMIEKGRAIENRNCPKPVSYTHLEILKFIKDRDKGKTNFHFEITADLLTEEELDFMSSLRPGLIQLEIGVQSTNPATIKEIRRNVSFEKLQEIVKRIHAGKNIHQHLDLIAGLPFEDMERFKQSFNDVYALKPEQFQLCLLYTSTADTNSGTPIPRLTTAPFCNSIAARRAIIFLASSFGASREPRGTRKSPVIEPSYSCL